MSTKTEPYGLHVRLLHDPHSALVRAIAKDSRMSGQSRAAADKVTRQPLATWLTASAASSATTVRRVARLAKRSRATPVFVLYRLPFRDCGSYSGLTSPVTQTAYRYWVRTIVKALGTQRAIAVNEPDALAQLDCLSTERQRQRQRLKLLRYAASRLSAQGSHVYMDAGHAGWVSATTMADRLDKVGVGRKTGFALNVSSFGSTTAQTSYGEQISRSLSGAHFIIDTSRNGAVGVVGWCNPEAARIGSTPTTWTSVASLDALLWVKTPGLSDGPCNGGPAAGDLWPKRLATLLQDP